MQYDPKCPYRIVQRGAVFFPQINERDFRTSNGTRNYLSLELARKFVRKQLTYKIKLSQEYWRKYNKAPQDGSPHEEAWLKSVDTMEAIVEEIEEEKPAYVPASFNRAAVLKYIVIESEDRDGRIHELPVMFPYVLIHKEMKECVWRALMESEHRFISVVGAGFCTVENNHVTCYGESESLGIKSRGTQDQQAFDRCQRSETSTTVTRN